MPIEIRELVIRATIDGTDNSDRPTRASAREGQTTTDVVEETVEQVLEVLRRRDERLDRRMFDVENEL